MKDNSLLNRRTFLKQTALTTAGLCLTDALIPALPSAGVPPNIILIMTDDQGWNQVSYRADPEIRESASDYLETPHMARAAAAGMRFTDAYAPNPICSPTRHSMLFGQNAARHVYAKTMNWMQDAPEWLTIPKALKQANPAYRTAHFGKWHIGLTPEQIGFDYSDGITNNAQGEFQAGVFKNTRPLQAKVATYNQAKSISVAGPTYSKQPFPYEDEDPKAAFGLARRSAAFIRESVAALRKYPNSPQACTENSSHSWNRPTPKRNITGANTPAVSCS